MQFSVASDCLSPPGTSASGKKGAEEASSSHLLSPLVAHQIAAWQHRGGWPSQTSQRYLDLWRYKQEKKEATISIVSWYLLQKPKPRFLWYCCYVMLSSGCRLGCTQEALAKSPCTPILKLLWEYNDEGYKGRKLSNNFKIKQMLKCRVFHIIVFYFSWTRVYLAGYTEVSCKKSVRVIVLKPETQEMCLFILGWASMTWFNLS